MVSPGFVDTALVAQAMTALANRQFLPQTEIDRKRLELSLLTQETFEWEVESTRFSLQRPQRLDNDDLYLIAICPDGAWDQKESERLSRDIDAATNKQWPSIEA